MSTIIRVKGVDWSSKDFPNISPFVSRSDLEFGYDLAARSSLLSDLSDNRHPLTPYKNDIAAGIHGIDPAINVGIDNGQGVRVELGYLLHSQPLAPVPIDGSVQFTVMVFGGKSPAAFPPDKVAIHAPSKATLFDYGSNVGGIGYSIDADNKNNIEARIKSSAPRLKVAVSPGSRSPIFLTYYGDRWTLRNGVTGESVSMTNADMDITAPIQVNTARPGATIGHSHSASTTHAYYPSIYQVAKWNRPLTEAEISEQCWRSLKDKPAL